MNLRALVAVCSLACVGASLLAQNPPVSAPAIEPFATTDAVPNDADDPAIWVDKADPSRSLMIGTNKVAAPDGAVYVFGIDGRVKQVVKPVNRPNNVDVEYGLASPAGPIDIAVVTERLAGAIRVFQVRADGLTAVDAGGIPVLAGQTGDAAMPMGISLYRRARDGAVFAIVAPKTGGTTNYLWQYRLTFDAAARAVTGTLVRRFGGFSGTGEIEAVAVDDAAGYVYYADEEFAVRKWHADPDHPGASTELALPGRDGFKLQREGIAFISRPDGTGFIVVSDQIPGGSELRLYRREGVAGRPHEHPLAGVIKTRADSTDGLDITSAALNPRLPAGLLVMMNSAGRNYQLYDLRDVLRQVQASPTRDQ